MPSKSSIESGRGHVTLGTDDSLLVKGLDEARRKFQSWGKVMAVAGAAIAAQGAAAQAPFHYALSVFAERGGELTRVSRQTGIEVGKLGSFAYALGGDMDAAVAGVAHMSSWLAEIARGSPEATRTLNRLGISFADLQRMSNDERLLRIADGLNTIHDAGERIAAQRAIFGRGGLELNLTGGRAGLEARMERNRQIGGQMTPEDVQLAREYNLAQRDLGIAMRATWSSIGAAVAPYMTQFLQLVTQIIVGVREWVDANRPLLLMMFRVAEILTFAGTAIGILGSIVYGASFAFSFLAGAITITSAFLGVLWGWAMFAATGFGVLKLVTWANVIALGAWKAAVWLVNAAHAVGAATLGIFTAASAAGTAGTGAFTLGLVAAWIWENLCTVGLFALVAALGALVIVLLAVAAPLAALPALLPIVAVGYLIWRLGILQAAWRATASFMGDAAGDAWRSIQEAFGGILATIRSTMGAAMDAVRAGDWALAWEIVKTGALLAWAQITLFVSQQWIIWKYAAVSIFNVIWDYLEDRFADAMTVLRVLWTNLWENLAIAFRTVIQAQMAFVVGTIRLAIADLLLRFSLLQRLLGFIARADQAQELANQERAAGNTGVAAGAARETPEEATRRIRQEAEEAQRRRDASRARRDAAREELRQAELEGLDRGRIEELQNELMELENNAAVAGLQPALPALPGRVPGEGFTMSGSAALSTGTFFADAMRGWFHAGGISPEQIAQRQRERQVVLAEQQLVELRRLRNPAFA